MVMVVGNSTQTTIESWFIPLDTLAIVLISSVILLAIIFLCLIIVDKTLYTVQMMLVANSCLAHLMFGIDILWMGIFKFHNDLKQIEYEDSFCIIRAYLGYTLWIIVNYSHSLQAIYRYLSTVYPARQFWRSFPIQFLLICLTWIFGFLCSSLLLFTHDIVYNIDNQICQISLRFSFSIIFISICLYLIPLTIILFIYLTLIFYIRKANPSVHSQQELKVIHQTTIYLLSLILVGLSYGIYLGVIYFKTPSKSHFRISYLFLDAYLIYIMIVLFQFNKPLQMSLMKQLKRRPNMIEPGMG